MTLCPKCKKELDKDNKFCPDCGIKIYSARKKDEAKDSKPEKQKKDTEKQHTDVKKPVKKKKSILKVIAKGALLTLLSILFVAVVATAWVFLDYQQKGSNQQLYENTILKQYITAEKMYESGNCALEYSEKCNETGIILENVTKITVQDTNSYERIWAEFSNYGRSNAKDKNFYDRLTGFDDSKIDVLKNKSQEKIDAINCNRVVAEFKEQGEEIECFDKGNIQAVLKDGRYLYTGKDGVPYTYDNSLPDDKRVEKVDLTDDSLLAIDENDKRSLALRLNGDKYFNPGGYIWDCSNNQKCERFIGKKAFRRGGARTIYARDRALFSAVNQDNSLMAFRYFEPQGICDPVFYSSYLAIQDLNEKNKYDNIKNKLVASLLSAKTKQEKLQILSDYYGNHEKSLIIPAIRNIPLYDSRNNEFVSFNEALSRISGGYGAIGSDPVGTMYEMFFGEKTRFISPVSGDWVKYENSVEKEHNTKYYTFKKIKLSGYGNTDSYPGIDGMCWMGDRTLFMHGSLSEKDGENVYKLTFDKNDLSKTPSLSKVYKEKERVLHRGNYNIYCINNKKEILFNNEYGELIIIDVNGNIKKSFDNVKIYKTLKNNNINKKYSFTDLNTKLTFVSK